MCDTRQSMSRCPYPNFQSDDFNNHGVQLFSTCIIGEVFLFVVSRNSYDLRLKLVYVYA